jgi:hypothetical protein
MRRNYTARLLLAVAAAFQIVTQAPVAAAASSAVKVAGAPDCYIFRADNTSTLRNGP